MNVGSVTSTIVLIILAAVPDTPTTIITQIYSETSGTYSARLFLQQGINLI